jgi:hypothetical protein
MPCHFAECHIFCYAECRYAECHYAECRRTVKVLGQRLTVHAECRIFYCCAECR